jgi:hypothetical protein
LLQRTADSNYVLLLSLLLLLLLLLPFGAAYPASIKLCQGPQLLLLQCNSKPSSTAAAAAAAAAICKCCAAVPVLRRADLHC